MDRLNARDREILAFDEKWQSVPIGFIADGVRRELGLSLTRYVQLRMEIIEKPGALVECPMQVKRLQRERDRKAEARASRVFLVDVAPRLPHGWAVGLAP